MALSAQSDPGDDTIIIDGVEYSGGDGTSPEEAVAIGEVPSHAAGIRAEKKYVDWYLQRGEANWKIQEQSLIKREDKTVDEMTVRTEAGQEKTFYFEISSFFYSDE